MLIISPASKLNKQNRLNWCGGKRRFLKCEFIHVGNQDATMGGNMHKLTLLKYVPLKELILAGGCNILLIRVIYFIK